MKNKEFMNQKVSSLSIEELKKAIKIKEKPFKISDDIKINHEDFERLTFTGWENIQKNFIHDVEINIINGLWNNRGMNNNIFYCELISRGISFKEIIRRKNA